MAKEKYSRSQLEAAREYLRRRLEDESSMRGDVESVLSTYIPLLVTLLVRGTSQSDIEEVLDDLVADLIADCEALAVDDHDGNRDALLLFLHQDIGGKTLDDRIRERVRTLYDEVFTLVAVGLLLGLNPSSITGSILSSLRDPWHNTMLEEFRDKVRKGEVAVPAGLDIDERHYGQGVPVSSLVALTDITVYGVSACWGYNDWLDHKDVAAGYYVFRGSSYDCDECDSHVGYHPVSDESSLPLYHNHCKCYVVWV